MWTYFTTTWDPEDHGSYLIHLCLSSYHLAQSFLCFKCTVIVIDFIFDQSCGMETGVVCNGTTTCLYQFSLYIDVFRLQFSDEILNLNLSYGYKIYLSIMKFEKHQKTIIKKEKWRKMKKIINIIIVRNWIHLTVKRPK